MGWTVYYRGEADSPIQPAEREILAKHTATWTAELDEGSEAYAWQEHDEGRGLRGSTKIHFSKDADADLDTLVRAIQELERLLPRFRFVVSDDYVNTTDASPSSIEQPEARGSRADRRTPEKVFRAGLERDDRMMYYIKGGDVWAVPRARPGEPKGAPKRLVETGIQPDPGYLYYLDADGDLARKPR